MTRGSVAIKIRNHARAFNGSLDTGNEWESLPFEGDLGCRQSDGWNGGSWNHFTRPRSLRVGGTRHDRDKEREKRGARERPQPKKPSSR